VYCVRFYTISYIRTHIRSWHTWPAQKENTSCTTFYVQDCFGLDTLLNSIPCDLILLHRFPWWYLYLFKISYWAEVVTSLHRSDTATSELTSTGCHLTHLASDLGWVRQKVHLYGTFLSGIRHLPPRMKNQHGLNEEKNLYRLVWVTKLLLAAIGLVFPALVLGYKSFNCSMYHVPVPTLIENFVWIYFKQLFTVAGSIIFWHTNSRRLQSILYQFLHTFLNLYDYPSNS
jgi:hypothetical protein